MKKYLYFLLPLLFLNNAYSQVLYTENFDNHSVGNLGTDTSGKTPGQWGWLTNSLTTQANSIFTIVNETNRGKVLDITAISPNNEWLIVHKPKLDQLINNRTTGNDVIKFEIDYFTGSKQPVGYVLIKLLGIGEVEDGVINPRFLSRIMFDKKSGLLAGDVHESKLEIISVDEFNKQYLPFNTWVTFIVYLDYPNRKVYFEIPYLNKAFAGDFLKNNPSTNLMQDYKPATISLVVSSDGTHQQNPVVTRNRYDNIKLTALNAVPPSVIALSTSEQLATKFNLYPNPATNIVNITNAENMLVNQVTVYDTTGKQLSTQSFNNQAEIQLNVENLASGTYLLHVQTNEGTAVKKLMKK